MRSPLRGDKRNDPDGSESANEDGIKPRRQNALVTGSQTDAVPEVEIKPGRRKDKTAQPKPPKGESTAKSSDKPKEDESNSKETESEPKGAEGTDEKKSKLLDFKKFDILELDCIFSDFKTTFDPFVQNRQDLEKSEGSFKKAVQSFGGIHPHSSIKEYVAALKTKLKDEKITVKIKEGALTIYEQGGAMVKGVSDAVTAVNAMLKLGKDLKEMPLTIQKGSEDAVDRAEGLDVQGILKREFKSVWDFAKIPKLKKAFNNNVEQIRGAPKMVRDFYRKTKEIVMEIYHAFADEEDRKKMEEEMAEDDDESKKEEEKEAEGGGDKKKKNAKKESGAAGEKGSKEDKKKDDFHKKLKFESVGLADIDNVFISLSSAINPFVETRERIQAAREAFENVVKTICNFDAKKELKDYIKELKKDAKEGNITIYIDEVDGEIKVKSIKGVKPPKPYRDAVQALKNIRLSGKEAVELEPHVQHGIEECVTRIKQIDPQRDFHSLLKKKTDVFTLPGKIKKFNDNRKKAQEIPGIIKEFCLYVERLLKDILEGLTGEKEETEENKGEKSGEKDEDSDKKDDGSDKKNEVGDEKDPDDKKDKEQSSSAKDEPVKKEDDSSKDMEHDSESEDGEYEELKD